MQIKFFIDIAAPMAGNPQQKFASAFGPDKRMMLFVIRQHHFPDQSPFGRVVNTLVTMKNLDLLDHLLLLSAVS